MHRQLLLKNQICFISLFTADSTMKGNRPVLIYFCYQTDSEVPSKSRGLADENNFFLTEWK
jgi:hypothetical protein